MNNANATQPLRRRSRSRSKGHSENKPIRVWCPGSYDILHYGRTNFLRRVKKEMSARFPKVHLVAGLYADHDLIASGRRPVFTVQERFDMVRANQWVDDVFIDVPLDLSKQVLKKYSCDYAVFFGEDESFVLKNDKWKELLECGLLHNMIPSQKPECSELSDNDIINRILLLEPRDVNNNTKSGRNWNTKKLTFPDSLSCKEMLRFATGSVPKCTDKIVYVGGSFDVLHSGHVNYLEKARSLGDFLYVGLHSDQAITKYAGENFPLMHWNERVMALLSCRYVSEVIIDAPVRIDEHLLDAFSIKCVVPAVDDYQKTQMEKSGDSIDSSIDVAKQRGVFHVIQMSDPAEVTTSDILHRVHDNWEEYIYAVRINTDTGLEKEMSVSENFSEKLLNLDISQHRNEGGERVPTLSTMQSEDNSVKFRYE